MSMLDKLIIEHYEGDAESLITELTDNSGLSELFETGGVALELTPKCKVVLKLIVTEEESDVPFLLDLADRPIYGALAPAFILEAIRFYAHIISTQEPKNDPTARINPATWHAIAVDNERRVVAALAGAARGSQLGARVGGSKAS